MKRLLCLVTMLVLGASVAFSGEIDEAKKDIQSTAVAKGLNAAAVDSAVRAFVRLTENGINEGQARNMVKLALQEGKTGDEVGKIAAAVSETCEKSGHARELAAVAEVCLKAKISAGNCERVMQATQYALGKDASPKQVRILAQEMVKNGSDAEGLQAAIRAVGDAVAKGESPVEARLQVSRAAMTGLKNGLKGEALASCIREQAQLREQTRERTQEQLRQQQGSGQGNQEQYQQRREGQIRQQTESSGEGGTSGSGLQGGGDLSRPGDQGNQGSRGR